MCTKDLSSDAASCLSAFKHSPKSYCPDAMCTKDLSSDAASCLSAFKHSPNSYYCPDVMYKKATGIVLFM